MNEHSGRVEGIVRVLYRNQIPDCRLRHPSVKGFAFFCRKTNSMIPLAGILIVFGAVVGGFALAGGRPDELSQPAELVIIAGSALGAMMVGNPAGGLIKTADAIRQIFRKPVYTKERYLATLTVLYKVFHFARRTSPTALEDAVDDPARNSLFSGYARMGGGPEALEFVCDTLRVTALGGVSPDSLDVLLEGELEVRRKDAAGPAELLANLADALPGFGIVAAVLGVILSMGAIREPPLKVGMKIASALIGTFTGILLAYGIVAPISARLEKIEDAEAAYFQTLRAALSSFARGMPAAIAIECARRAIPPDVRPDFEATEKACRRVEQPIRD
jgi:chemotaxis protein MotA